MSTTPPARYAFQIVPVRTLDDGRPWYPYGLGTTPSLKARLLVAAARRRLVRRGSYPQTVRPDTLRDAFAIIEHGRPYAAHWCDEGDAESGPMGGTVYGYRWGQTKLERSRNGSVHLIRETRRGDEYGYPERFATVHDSSGGQSYTGLAHMIADHLAAITSNASRNGLDFVRTGRRDAAPTR